jgi:chromosome segregation ATPase
MLSPQSQNQTLQPHPNQPHPNQNQPQPVSNQEVESLRSLVSQQQAQIDVLTRSLEQLVINYRELKNDSEASRRRDTQTQTRLTTVETGQTEMRRTLETVEYRANIGFQNSTADDDARQYMLDEREMVGDDSVLTDGEIQRAATRINDRRPNRRR